MGKQRQIHRPYKCLHHSYVKADFSMTRNSFPRLISQLKLKVNIYFPPMCFSLSHNITLPIIKAELIFPPKPAWSPRISHLNNSVCFQHQHTEYSKGGWIFFANLPRNIYYFSQCRWLNMILSGVWCMGWARGIRRGPLRGAQRWHSSFGLDGLPFPIHISRPRG